MHQRLALLVVVIVACRAKPVPKAQSMTSEPAYQSEVQAWSDQRVANLKKENGWLTLAGLYWLKEGINSFGSGSTQDLVFPPGAPANMGSFVKEGQKITLVSDRGAGLQILKEDSSLGPIQSALLLASDAADAPTKIRVGTFTFYVIDRAGRLGIRLYDSASAARTRFSHIDRFPVDANYRITATWKPAESKYTVKLNTVVDGVIQEEEIAGTATFVLDGKKYSLQPIVEKGETDYFFMFRDQTSGKETYGAGRFLYAKPPKDGYIVLDFNKAFNPPCAFTNYATCPLPPPQNHLSLRIEAGEKQFGAH